MAENVIVLVCRGFGRQGIVPDAFTQQHLAARVAKEVGVSWTIPSCPFLSVLGCVVLNVKSLSPRCGTALYSEGRVVLWGVNAFAAGALALRGSEPISRWSRLLGALVVPGKAQVLPLVTVCASAQLCALRSFSSAQCWLILPSCCEGGICASFPGQVGWERCFGTFEKLPLVRSF